jgi:thiol-disulfide isomerase/thioredoxin
VPRLPRLARPAAIAARAAPAARLRISRRAAACAVAVAALAAAGCDGGAIAQDVPQSSGQSFVSGSYSTTFYQAGHRPAAPGISARTLTGQRVSLASYRGSVLVLNFWGSWCTPCQEEAPALAALATRYQSRGVRFLGVDIRDDPISAEGFMRTYQITYPSLNDPGDQIALAFRDTVPPAGIPTTLVIDRSGRIAARIVGGVTYSGLRTLITEVSAGRS